jgi:hypothetical protein
MVGRDGMKRNVLLETFELLITPSYDITTYVARLTYLTRMYFVKTLNNIVKNNYPDIPRQLDLIKKRPWNILVVLDAARYDYVAPIAEKLGMNVIPTLSSASITIEWFNKTWCISKLGKNVIYISANPYIRKTNTKGCTKKTIDAWKLLWDNNLSTVLAHKVLNYTKTHLKLLKRRITENKERLVVHLLQPHAPYLGWPNSLIKIWKLGAPHNIDIIYKLFLKYKNIKRNLINAYIYSIEYALESIFNFILWAKKEFNDICIAVTADHGELFGEYGLIFHPNINVKELRIVPWIEFC